MKDIYILYTIAVIAVAGILICFVGYTTDTLPMQIQKQVAVTTTPPAAKKKSCGCCEESVPRFLKEIRVLRDKNPAQHLQYTRAMALLLQYGSEEGLRRLKQSDPEIAAQLERLSQEHPAGSEKTISSTP